MNKSSKSEKLILNEIMEAAQKLKMASRGLSIGEMITLIRNQLGMSQSILAKHAGVPQATVSLIENSKKKPNLSTS